MRKDRVLIGYIIFTVFALVASFLKWGLWYNGSEPETSGWNESLRLYGLIVYNWMVGLAIILIGLALIFKELKVWIPLKWGIFISSIFSCIYLITYLVLIISKPYGHVCEGYVLFCISLVGFNTIYFNNSTE
jgi:hypothetical protein